MSRTLVHASLEHPNAPWGGIGTALGLLLQSASELSRPSILITPEPSVTPMLKLPYVTDVRLSSTLQIGSEAVYSAAQRISLGQSICSEMRRILDDELAPSSVDLVIHNEELADLSDSYRESGATGNVYFAHGLLDQEHPTNSDLWKLQGKALMSAKAVCCASTYQSSMVSKKTGRPAYTVTLPLSGLIDFSKYEDRKNSLTRPLGIISVGRMVPQKGFDLLIRAMANVSHSARELTIIAGHGSIEYKDYCLSLADKHNVEVSWQGWSNRQDVRLAVSESSYLLTPSRFEPLGLIAAEAIAIGTPVIGSDVGGLADLLRSCNQTVVNRGTGDREFVANLSTILESALAAPSRVTDPKSLQRWSWTRSISELDYCLSRSLEP